MVAVLGQGFVTANKIPQKLSKGKNICHPRMYIVRLEVMFSQVTVCQQGKGAWYPQVKTCNSAPRQDMGYPPCPVPWIE